MQGEHNETLVSAGDSQYYHYANSVSQAWMKFFRMVLGTRAVHTSEEGTDCTIVSFSHCESHRGRAKPREESQNSLLVLFLDMIFLVQMGQ